MPYNVADLENLIRSIIVYNIKQQFPDLDTSENSVFDDVFVKPAVSFAQPFIAATNEVEFMLNLDNAELMTEESLNAIGEGNFKLSRLNGDKASTVLKLSYNVIVPNENLLVPVGATFSTDGGLQYQTTQEYEYTYNEMLTKYNPNTLTYDIEVNVEAYDIGTSYNVGANTITNIDTNFSTNILSVTNEAEVSNGTDTESNVDYAERIRSYYTSRYLNTKPGYKEHIYNNYQEIEDIYVVGYGDTDMVRDLVTVLNDLGNPEDIHIGGKVDIYLKGTTYEDASLTINVNSPKIQLAVLYSQIDTGTIVVNNLSDITKTPVFTFADDGSDNCIVTIDNTGDQSYNPDIVNSFQITYDYDPGSGTVSADERFSVGLMETSLNTPFKDISSIYETNEETNTYDNTYYTIERTRLDGTVIPDSSDTYYQSSQENAKITFQNMNSVINGTELTVNYIINSSINSMADHFDVEENRVITTDLLIKEAESIYINVAFNIKMKANQTLDSTKESILQSAVFDFFDSLALGSRVEESDIIGYLYRQSDINIFLEYVSLPFTSFYVPADPADAMIAQRDGTYIDTEQKQYPVLNKFSVTEV